MSCKNCNSNATFIPGFNLFYASTNCGCESEECNGNIVNARCVKYTGPNLSCSTVQTNDNLEDIIIKIDSKLCTAIGDYTLYDKACIDDGGPITTEEEFVERISQFACEVRSDLDTFVTSTFPAYQDDVDARISAIENPGLTCSSAGIIPSDTLASVYAKYCVKFENIDDALDLSTVSWGQCFTVSPAPISIAEGFETLLSQICQVKAIAESAGAGSNSFNNSSSCLAGGTTDDTLEETINLIKTRLCQTPTFDINALSWNCVNKPSSDTTDLQSAMQEILARLDSILQDFPYFDSGDFNVANVDNSNACLGKIISLAASPNVDRFVAATPSDMSPGTLSQKLQAGTNITFDTVSVPGKLIISASGGAAADEKVRAFSGGVATGFLDEKLSGATDVNGLTIDISQDVVGDTVKISPSVNMQLFASKLLQAIADEPELKTLFCEIVASCPSPCSAPIDVIATYMSGTTSSTTTTTTTTSAP